MGGSPFPSTGCWIARAFTLYTESPSQWLFTEHLHTHLCVLGHGRTWGKAESYSVSKTCSTTFLKETKVVADGSLQLRTRKPRRQSQAPCFSVPVYTLRPWPLKALPISWASFKLALPGSHLPHAWTRAMLNCSGCFSSWRHASWAVGFDSCGAAWRSDPPVCFIRFRWVPASNTAFSGRGVFLHPTGGGRPICLELSRNALLHNPI